ncbi:cupin domain-containing protein [Nonomuraea sediminis]|uniref:cupin domain-containing protein n=1 Tax=Nonomuraea sediminis TaxID=2835864 RepID=UPI001BDC0A25|nr:cupin domain-containing protein [Nonomuraea sediminis]
MSIVDPKAAVIRLPDAEVLQGPANTGRLLLDSSSTGGALSAVRMTLAEGANGAVPHRHTTASELFFLVDGSLQVLAGEDVLTLEAGDLAVVPPNMDHAFAAAPGAPADLLIVVTPGIERFDYFRLLARLQKGEASLEELLESQERFDNHFVDSPTWTKARA